MAAVTIPWGWLVAIIQPDSPWRTLFVSCWPIWQLLAGLGFICLVHFAKHFGLNLSHTDHRVDRFLLLMAAAMSLTSFEMSCERFP